MNNDVIDSDLNPSAIKHYDYDFPIHFEFKIGTLANDFVAKDANNSIIAYVRQKMFKFKEDIQIFSNESKSDIRYTIKADRIIDFNSCYEFRNSEGDSLGKVARKGMRSIWKASYEIMDQNGNNEYSIREENPWSKVGDALLGEVPLISFFTGYLFNPKYIVTDKKGNIIARLKKEPSFFGRRFKLEKISDFKEGDGEQIMLSFMMMALLERRRG